MNFPIMNPDWQRALTDAACIVDPQGGSREVSAVLGVAHYIALHGGNSFDIHDATCRAALEAYATEENDGDRPEWLDDL